MSYPWLPGPAWCYPTDSSPCFHAGWSLQCSLFPHGSLAVCKLLEPGLILPPQLPLLACSPSGRSHLRKASAVGSCQGSHSPTNAAKTIRMHSCLFSIHSQCWQCPCVLAAGCYPSLGLQIYPYLPREGSHGTSSMVPGMAEICRGVHIPAPPSSSHPLYSGQRSWSGWKPCKLLQSSVQVCSRGRFGPAAHQAQQAAVAKTLQFPGRHQKAAGDWLAHAPTQHILSAL